MDIASSTELEEEEEELSECVVCLETFEIGDKVAWSKGHTGCKHVWHVECISSWLRQLKHEECPSCRASLLPELQRSDLKSAEEGRSTEAPSTTASTAAGQFVILKGQDCVTSIIN